MEPHRRSYRVRTRTLRRQAGITMLGLLILATIFGTVGLAALKITPLYVQGMRVRTVLSDLKEELDGTGTTSSSVRMNLSSRLYIEGISLGPGAVSISPGTNGYNVRVHYDNRARFLADIWFLIDIDEQIEIRR